jgi:uncharacterized membrane-anchored protein
VSWFRRSRRRRRSRCVAGVARVGPRTKDLAKRIGKGDIAVINHRDLDRIAAESLIAAGVAAIVNADESMSGRYPNGGPERVLAARVPLLDAVGPGVMDAVRDGEEVEIRDDALWRNGEKVATGELMTAGEIELRTEEARLRIGTELRAFARNTLEFIDKEAERSFEPLQLPPLETKIRGRQALVVVRGLDYKSDLRALRAYIREYRPVLIAVDGGADALREAGLKPDIIVGDMDSVSDEALRAGAEVVVHAYRDGSAPGLARVEDLGITPVVFPAAGTSEDVALLLADEKGAQLIVAVGTHATLVEFLDKGRSGMASTFLTRLRVGGKLVDAKGVSRLYRSRIPAHTLILLVVATVITFAVALAVTPGGVSTRELLDIRWHDFLHWLHGLFP